MACIICSNQDLYYDHGSDQQTDPPLLEKLQFCIPEVGWNIGDQFCRTCVLLINNFYSFKNSCLQSYEHRIKTERESHLKSEIIQEDDRLESLSHSVYNDSSDLVDEVLSPQNHTEPFSLVTCFICESKFEAKSTLEKHLSHDHLKILDGNGTKEIQKTDENLVSSNLAEKQKPDVYYDISVKDEIRTNDSVADKHTKKGRKPVRTYSCEICGEFFNFARNVVSHAVNEHNMDQKSVKPYSCDICETRFSCCANLLQHKKYHEKTRSLICAFCGKTFITKSDLTVHEHTHYNRRNYKCEKCDKAFNTNKTLRSHNLVCHTNPSLWKYCCSICGRRFPLKSGYDQHMKRHLGDKKHACHFCEKAFVSASELKKHIVFHSNVKAFKCHLCEREYKEKKIYEIHLTKIHNIGDAKIPVRVKKFTCDVCGNMFADRPKLERHMCTHTGLKPYPCDLCVKRFTDKSYLKHHKKVIHGIDPTTVPG